MTTSRAIAFALVLALSLPLTAQGFDAAGFFGESYKPSEIQPDSGTLTNSLTEAPAWMDFTGSGSGRARANFHFDGEGLAVLPDALQPSCEAVLDLGVSGATGTLKLIELTQGGKVAIHLHDIADTNAAWLLELRRTQDDWQLSIRARTTNRYVAFPDSKQTCTNPTLPAELKFEFKDGLLSLTFGGVTSTAKAELKNGVSIGLAFTDERARVRDLALNVTLNQIWMADATQRLLARRTLERLREYATVGLLAGLVAFRHPEMDKATTAYSVEETRDRSALGQDIYERAEVLMRIASKHPEFAAAQHEAGLAALVAGQLDAGFALLLAADELLKTPITSLAIGEASRRLGDLNEAEKQLQAAQADLPDVLRPDLALVKARLAADRGDFRTAHELLLKAHRDYPDHIQIAEFAASADILLNPSTLQATSFEGPLGLKLYSDLDEESLKQIVGRLNPYIEKLRLWLPDLPKKLDQGVLAIFSSPIEYLHAALLVAGDNLDNVAGMYLPHGIGGERTVMACRAFGEEELQRTLVHELWHMCVAATGRSQTMPRWLNEGMAVFLSAGHEDKESRMVYDELPSEFVAFGDAPLGMLDAERAQRAIDARPAEFYVPGEVRSNYLSAWAVVWFYASSTENVALVRAMLKGDAEAMKQATSNMPKLLEAAVAAMKKAGIE